MGGAQLLQLAQSRKLTCAIIHFWVSCAPCATLGIKKICVALYCAGNQILNQLIALRFIRFILPERNAN